MLQHKSGFYFLSTLRTSRTKSWLAAKPHGSDPEDCKKSLKRLGYRCVAVRIVNV